MRAAAGFGAGPALQQIKNDRKCDEELCLATALQLEKTGVKWDLAQSWTTYLFSGGSRGHLAMHEKHKLVEEAETELDAIIKQSLEEDAVYRKSQEKKIFPCRLLLSNIAAGAGTDDVAWFLSDFKYDM